jgi:hypothetical protein
VCPRQELKLERGTHEVSGKSHYSLLRCSASVG